jgi:Ca-activated chloride channel family protein
MRILGWLSLICTCVLVLGCGDAEPPSSTTAAVSAGPPPLELLFTYSSEKKDWLSEAITTFNASQTILSGGQRITVSALPMGSGECIDEIIAGVRKPHLISPASAAFITMGNANAQAITGKPMVTSTESLVLSPVVIAMWQPMAEKLGWPNKAIGWDVRA